MSVVRKLSFNANSRAPQICSIEQLAAGFEQEAQRWLLLNPGDRGAALLKVAASTVRQLERLRQQEARRSAVARRDLARWQALAPRIEGELAAAVARPRGERVVHFERDSAGELVSARTVYE